jgi:hypothetical protein
MAKKPSPRNAPDQDLPDSENDPLHALDKERGKLEKRFGELTNKADSQLSELGFWGFIGGVGLMADWAFMGGLGTAVAVWSGAEFLAYKSRARDVEKDLKKVREKIIDLQEERFRANLEMQKQQPKPVNGNKLKDEFSPAAKAEIEALQKKLAELSGQVDKLQDDKEKGLDKPKFKPPFGKKP